MYPANETEDLIAEKASRKIPILSILTYFIDKYKAYRQNEVDAKKKRLMQLVGSCKECNVPVYNEYKCCPHCGSSEYKFRKNSN